MLFSQPSSYLMKKHYIIADSGSTKCQWTLIEKDKKKTISTIGISPYFLTTEAIISLVKKAFDKKCDCTKIEAIYFYGTGLSNPNNIQSLKKALKAIFKNATLDIQTDLVGAARATCQKKKRSGLYFRNRVQHWILQW